MIWNRLNSKYSSICAVAVAFLVGAVPALAHCGKCAVDGQALAVALNSGKVNLAAATTLAEATTKGVAVRATLHKHKDGCFVEVHCMMDDKIMAVQVDCATGKPGKPAEVKDLESHVAVVEADEAEVATVSSDAPSDADVQSKLDGVTQATLNGRYDEAETSLGQLEGLKNLSASLQDKVAAVRKTLNAAKALSGMTKMLP